MKKWLRAWGALPGLLLGIVPFLVGEPTSERPLWLLGVVFISSTTLLGAVSAAGTLALARKAEKRELPGASTDVVDVGRTQHETRELSGGRR